MVFNLGITMLIHNKDDIEFVTEFPCFLGHPVGEEKGGAHGNKHCMIRTQSSRITWNIFPYEILCTVYLQVEFKTGLLVYKNIQFNIELGLNLYDVVLTIF